jgi:Leucine-rich repeat (LRR) protein
VEAPGAAEGDEDLCLPFFELTDHLAALTKLAVQGCPLEDMLDPGVCMLTQLRHLYLAGSWDLEELPSEVSSLRHLTLLDVSDTRLQELPAELGTWMPQLEVLVIAHSRMSVLPDHLDRLTSLDAESCPIHSLAAVEHLTGLKELQLFDAILNPPWEAISKLARLETLVLSLVEGGAAVSPSSLPFLRKLSLSAQDPFQVAAQLVGCGEHLTRLMLVGVLRPEEQLVPDFGQLGVLPVLQELVVCGFGLPRLVAASTWLQQQPRLTWLRLDQQGHVGEPAAWALPPQLQELQLFGSVIPSELPASLAQLTGLSQLCLCKAHFNQLPGWLSRLTRLENLKVSSIMGQFYGWQVLAELPLLRRLEGSSNVPIVMAPLLRRAPHLCWAQE